MTPPNFSFFDIQMFLLIKWCFIIFLVTGLVCLYKKLHPLILLGAAGVLTSISYLLLVNNLGLSFWGLRGDEMTIGAMFQMFAHHSFFSDFAFPDLVPWYPPLFFYVFAVFGRIFDWNGMMMVKLSVASTFLMFPIIVYLAQAWYWKNFEKHRPESAKEKINPTRLAWLLAPLVAYMFNDWDAFILKPYEVLAAMGSVLWVSALLNDLHHGISNKKRLFVYSLTGGILFMTYYLWLIFGAIAIALSGLFVDKKDQFKFYLRLILTAIGTLIFASPFLAPLVALYLKNGTENWSVAFMPIKGLAIHADFVRLFSWRGILLLSGFVTMILYRKNIYIRSLLLLFISGYIWYIMGLSTILFFLAPIQEFKAFDFYHAAIMAYALAFGLEKIYVYLNENYQKIEWRSVLGVPALCMLSAHMIFGAFTDDPTVQERRVGSKNLRKPVFELVEFLKNDPENINKKTVGPGAGEIHAFVPMNMYIYFNQHNNHPATRFSEKKMLLKELAKQVDPDKFAKMTQEISFGPINRFILFKEQKEKEVDSYYKSYFHVDNFPNGVAEEVINFHKDSFSEKYFEKTFENNNLIIFEKIENK